MTRRNIAVFFDGTGQDRSKLSPAYWSNVVLLHDAVEMSTDSDCVQSRKYLDGVGTRTEESLTGGGFGIDLDKRIEEAYDFVYEEVNNAVEDGEEPHLYLFGFSRGAFAARWLAALIQFAGVRKDDVSTRKLMKYHRANDTEAIAELYDEGLLLPAPPIDFLGVWDTVKASIDPSFGIERVPEIVKRAFHALAIDEWRYIFKPTRFEASDKVVEVWFPGCHTDVGGGYLERAIANESLRWMVAGAIKAGLRVDVEQLRREMAARSQDVVYHDELTAGTNALLWKTVNFNAGFPGRFYREIGPHDYLHPSVQQLAANAPGERAFIPDTCVAWNDALASRTQHLA